MITSREWIQSQALGDFLGASPAHALVLGAGYGREEIKAELLKRASSEGRVLSAGAVTSLQDLALGILGWTKAQLLGPLARQEALRWWIAQPAVSRHLSEVKELRRERTFFSKLDSALQAGRMSYSTEEERSVFEARLDSERSRVLREELKTIQAVFESWMQSVRIADPPLLLALARERLLAASDDERTALHARIPKQLTWMGARARESREALFWETLSLGCTLGECPASVAPQFKGADAPALIHERWHSLDDVAERLADQITAEISSGRMTLPEMAIVIADRPEVRRTIARVFGERGIPIADPRDPLELRRSEKFKLALQPLSCTASRFEREEVIAYFQTCAKVGASRFGSGPESGGLRTPELRALMDQAVTRGLGSYTGGLSRVGKVLTALDRDFGGRKSIGEMSDAHLRWIDAQGDIFTPRDYAFWSRFWHEFEVDLLRLPAAPPRASALFWMERIQSRLAGTEPPIARAKPESGLALYRAGQAPLHRWKHVFFFSIEADWLDGGRAGDFYWSERDRDVLSAEFDVRAGAGIRLERLSGLQRWISAADTITVLEEEYGFGGDERPASAALWAEVFDRPELLGELRKTRSQGAHLRWLPSFSAQRSVQPQIIELGAPRTAAANGNFEWSASSLDHYTKCAFLGLAQGRWKLEDLKDPESDLWPEVKGILLHEAAALLLRSRGSAGVFERTAAECLDEVWNRQPPRGLIRSRRVESTVKARLKMILEAFAEDEQDVYARVPSELVISDDRMFSYVLSNGVKISGRPDRIDRYQTPDGPGLWVIDYKTSTDIPTGRDLEEHAYRLQLPLYALAAQKKLGETVIGVQYISLVRKGTRSSGVMFARTNGKTEFPITKLRSDSKSLFADEPASVWKQFEEKIVASANLWKRGVFSPVPKFEQDCRGCMARDLCGVARKSSVIEGDA